MNEMTLETEVYGHCPAWLEWEAAAMIAEAEAEMDVNGSDSEIQARIEAWDAVIDAASEEQRAEIGQWFRALAEQVVCRRCQTDHTDPPIE